MVYHKMNKMLISTCGMLLLGTVWGCGTSEYEARVEKRLRELQSGSKFNFLSDPIDIPGTSVSIRLPKKNDANKNSFPTSTDGFVNPPLKEGAMVNGKAVDAKRLKPGMIEINDLKVTYEGTILDRNKGNQPYYLYIAVSTGTSRENFPRIMRNALAEKFPDTTELTPYQAQTPEGRSINWQMCRGTSNQEFYYVSEKGQGQSIQLPGTFELFFLDENDTLVTLAWRLPTSIEQNIEYDLWKNMVAGCVKITPKAGAGGQ